MLEVKGVTVRFGDTMALDGIDLAVSDGEVVAVLGPSGSGKSTLLRVVAGLQQPDGGSVAWNGTDLAGTAPHLRRFGMVFQDFALFPHLDVAGNVAFGPRMQGVDAERREALVSGALDRVELTGFGARSVSTLSGGQAQRVALARALASRPRMLLLDEPLGSLDRALRERLVVELRPILAAPDITALYVTHDQAEAFAVADRVAVVIDGRVVQAAPPREIWSRPASEAVAGLLGFRTIVDAAVAGGLADTPIGRIPVSAGTPAGDIRLVVRPEAFAADPDGTVAGTVCGITFRGGDSLVMVDTGGGIVEAALTQPPPQGTHITLRVDPDGVAPLPSP
jgi:thiamine transport system ATP-binding protein